MDSSSSGGHALVEEVFGMQIIVNIACLGRLGYYSAEHRTFGCYCAGTEDGYKFTQWFSWASDSKQSSEQNPLLAHVLG